MAAVQRKSIDSVVLAVEEVGASRSAMSARIIWKFTNLGEHFYIYFLFFLSFTEGLRLRLVSLS